MPQHEQPADRPPRERAEGSTWGRAGERPGAPRAEDQLASQGVRRRPRPDATVDAVTSWVDQAIQQAQRQGSFDNLAGAGQRLPEVDTRTDPDWWVRGLIEREQLDLSDAMPGVMQLRREKATFPESLLDLPDEDAVRTRLEDFNERVLADRRRPHVGPHAPPVVGRVDAEEMVGRWRELRGAREQAESTDGRPGPVEKDGRPGPVDEKQGTEEAPYRRRWLRRLRSR